jgi:ParB family transcriptional regulator, chromosome partitioning protein
MKPRELNANNFYLPLDLNITAGNTKVAMKEAGAGSSDLWKVPPDALHILPNFNVRVRNPEYEAHVRGLADSMKAGGYKQDKPLSGYVAFEDGSQKIYITDGHSRLEAVRLAIHEGAEIPRVPIVVAQAGATIEDLTVSLATSNNGKPLSPFELGIVCKRLIGFGWEIKEIAVRLTISEQYVRNLLSLMAAPLEIRQMVMEEQISASTAVVILDKHGDKALEVIQAAQERAASKGNGKVTQRHVDPAHEFKKQCRDRARDMFILLQRVITAQQHPDSTTKLPDDLFNEIYTMYKKSSKFDPNPLPAIRSHIKKPAQAGFFISGWIAYHL